MTQKYNKHMAIKFRKNYTLWESAYLVKEYYYAHTIKEKMGTGGSK